MKISLLFSFIIGGVAASAQSLVPQLVASGGGSAVSGSSPSLEWSIGETAIPTLNAGTHVLTQGFHQTLLTITSVSEWTPDDFAINVYPNPVMTALSIQLGKTPDQPLPWTLTDMGGKTVMTDRLTSTLSQYEVSSLASGVYFIQIALSPGDFRTWKIVKQN